MGTNFKISVFGESHTRSFSHIENLIPVFLSSGSTINLGDEFYRDVISRIKKSHRQINNMEKDCIYFLYLGEPNVRYQLNKDWYVHWDKKFKHNGEINKSYLEKCISNYKKILDSLGFEVYIITPTTAFNPSLGSLDYFNKRLKEEFKNIVIDIHSDTIDPETNEVKEKYRDPDYERDPIHLNSKVSNIFLSKITEMGIVGKEDVKRFKKAKDFFSLDKDIKSAFNKSPFGTYSLK